MSIALTMIVKDEEAIIGRCLEGTLPFIDYWAIVDTGSTDRTEEEIRKAVGDKPGEYIKHEWKGFGEARTKAFEIARGKADYALAVDADEVPEGTIGELTKDTYSVWYRLNNVKYLQKRLFNLKHQWYFKGVRHEYPTCDVPFTDGVIEELSLKTFRDGSRARDTNKYFNDALAIGQALLDDPTDSRLVFYLAQSWRDSGDDVRALRHYKQRAEMGPGSNFEEVYISYLEAGRAARRLGFGDQAIRLFYLAYWNFPARIEAARELALIFQHRVGTSPKAGTLFVED